MQAQSIANLGYAALGMAIAIVGISFFWINNHLIHVSKGINLNF